MADPGPLVFHDRPAPAPDEAAVSAFAAEVTTWLDQHLTALQSGEQGLLEEVAVPGTLEATGPGELAAVTSGLASPDRPVDAAVYHLVVAHAGAPVWLRAHVTVFSRDGSRHEVGFVFTPDPAAGPRLVAAGPGPL